MIGDIDLRDNRFRAVGVFALFAVLPLLIPPVFSRSYLLGVFIDMMILALFAMSWNLLFGYTGMLSFGHAGLYGVGAYAVGFTLNGTWIFPQVASLPVAFGVSLALSIVAAAVIGLFCVQRGNIYFAMLTLAFNMVLYEVFIQFDDITSGTSGLLFDIPDVAVLGLELNPADAFMYYYFTLAVLTLSVLVMWRIVNSPYGRLLTAIRENPERANFIGLNVKHYQWSAFVISGMFAGLAGALVSVRNLVVTPGLMFWAMSAEPLLATLIGGPYAFFGPVLGAVFFISLEEFLVGIVGNWHIALGIILIPVVLYLPNGIIGTISVRNVRSVVGRVVPSVGPDSVDDTEENR